ncbi:rhamnogalacturonan endolyase [Lacibacter cauensis]|uniref:Rhamnogalacturonan endolyase n=1 Tax=Lacibacter cauensis TaxID=510947 RepID=A0A562SWD3_9BACT|nr:T9SS type A sorting domain-containing protein [Lacibacter cauensis]TWI85595.1 rhamnogalacturonan endolyase [Lacibacter cauensis]
MLLYLKKGIICLLFLCCVTAQLFAQRKMEKLNRGTVAVRVNSSSVFISWRLFGTETNSTAFNIYRDDIKLNAQPINGATNYTDQTTTNGVYKVKAVVNGVEESTTVAATVWAKQYLQIPIQQPAGGTTPDAVAYTYTANDASVGDVDGDGEYEIILKWDPTNSKDNSQSGYTGNVYLDAYKMNGTRLWRIDLGINIRAGAHYTQFLVYDFDSDGKAEVACKTADGTKDGVGTIIGSSTADYRNSSGYVLSGPEYLTVFNGLTGAAMDTKPYTPARGTVSSWGDSYGNRVDRFIATVACLDGVNPSMVFGRGYYTRLVRSAWDFKNGQLTQRWIFDSNTSGNGGYAGMGNHQLMTADANGDGKDEVYSGSSAVNYDGTGFFTNTLGHGDALHITDLDPDRPGLEFWQCYEEPAKYAGKGLRLVDAATGVPIWGVNATGDIGRALAADIDPRYKGYECWGATGYLYNVKGDSIGPSRPSMNHAVWWDGDLLRELLDGDVLDKWDYTSNKSTRLITLYQEAWGYGGSNNSTKKNPCLTVDLLGDWREEIILRSTDQQFLNIYTTVNPTTHRIYTLMHDPQYRMAIAWQNAAYNQPPHPGFYLGDGMNTPPTPNIQLVENIATPVSNVQREVMAVDVYPNPSVKTFRIKANGSFRFYIYDAGGQLQQQGTAINQIETGAQLGTGIYFIKVMTKKQTTTVKLIKQ